MTLSLCGCGFKEIDSIVLNLNHEKLMLRVEEAPTRMLTAHWLICCPRVDGAEIVNSVERESNLPPSKDGGSVCQPFSFFSSVEKMKFLIKLSLRINFNF